ncbi:MAG TPA: hypothetical protein VK524_25100 [Polyangiaceae bacterium]|nr:hypothetical protein [Polyangiaceae bacterium]
MKGRYRGDCAAAVFGALLLLCGCGDDESEDADRPLPPPELSILSVRGNHGEPWNAGGAATLSLGCPASSALVVRLGEPDLNDNPRALKNWLLRPPGGCGERAQCGYVSFELSSSGAVVYSADTALPELSFAATDTLLQSGFVPGVYGFRATLRNPDGSDFLLAGAPVSASVELTLEAAADCVGDAGS